jgi:3-methyladenine DNA glycosylase AlkD
VSAARSKVAVHKAATGRSQRAARSGGLDALRHELRRAAEPARIAAVRRALQVDRGGYGEGDTIIGVSVPAARAIASRFADLPIDSIVRLLRSPIHEERLVALLLLARRFETADDKQRKRIFQTYLANTAHVNNWDLVDTSAPAIVGAHLLHRTRAPLRRLARSKSVWERRIAVVSTLAFIRAGEHDETFRLARLLIRDEHDLIRKAVGWMLREVGKRDEPRLIAFLERHAHQMPRVMLRYAVERLDARVREELLARSRRKADAPSG